MMKSFRFSPILFLIALIAFQVVLNNELHAQPNNAGANIPGLEKIKICSFQPGEVIFYNENCIQFNQKGVNTRFITYPATAKEEKYYVYENAIRKGPYNSFEEVFIHCNAEENCAAYKSTTVDWVNNAEKYNIKAEDEGVTININGKNYGTFVSFTHFEQNDYGFFAIIGLDSEMKQFLLTSEGKKIEIKGSPSKLNISPDGKKVIVSITGSLTMNDLMAGKFDVNDMKNSYFMDGDGKSYGPYSTDLLELGGVWFDKWNNNFYFVYDGYVYMNGEKIYKHIDGLSNCNYWFSLNGTTFAWDNYDKITFPDGSSYPYPLAISSSLEKGKIFLSWITLENGTDIYLCKKAL